jgi:drug/metabolite transporter (DMT)-like permease
MGEPGRARVVATFVVLSLIWGTTWAAIRIGLQGVPPISGVALRFTLAAAILFALSPSLGVRYGGSRRELALWGINGVLAFCVSYGVVYWAQQWVPSGLASILFATMPLFVAVLAHRLLPGERLNRRGLAGMLVGFAGVAVIFSEDLTRLGGPQMAGAAVVLLVSPFVSAVASVAIKRWGAGIHPVSLAAVPMAIAAGVMGALALATERHQTFVIDAASVGAILYLGVFGSAVTFTLYYWLLRHVRATRVSLIAYTAPVVAVAVGAVFLAEPMTARTLGGSALVLLGVALAVHRTPAAPAPATATTAAAAAGHIRERPLRPSRDAGPDTRE